MSQPTASGLELERRLGRDRFLAIDDLTTWIGRPMIVVPLGPTAVLDFLADGRRETPVAGVFVSWPL